MEHGRRCECSVCKALRRDSAIFVGAYGYRCSDCGKPAERPWKLEYVPLCRSCAVRRQEAIDYSVADELAAELEGEVGSWEHLLDLRSRTLRSLEHIARLLATAYFAFAPR
jgi:hypothetical protein